MASQVEASGREALERKYRGATIQDLDLPPALSFSTSDTISNALLAAYERDYTHLTIVDSHNRALKGYLSIPRLKGLLEKGVVTDRDDVQKAMFRFRTKGAVYKIITPDTDLVDLELFFDEQEQKAGSGAGKNVAGDAQDDDAGFAVVTDATRRFVLAVVTRQDLDQFVKRRGG